MKINNFTFLFFLSIAQFTFGQEWVKIWSDEFDYTGLPNTTKWTYDVGGGGWGNGESQYYTDARSENARVENGNLIIEARKENYEGKNYTSARLVSKGLGDWKYGKIEVRAKIPTGKGMWPAIWMLPSENVYGIWPKSGEIDSHSETDMKKRKYSIDDEIWIEKADYGKPIRLKDLCDIDEHGNVESIERSDKRQVVHWVANGTNTALRIATSEQIEIVYGKFEQNEYPVGTVVQLERIGYAIIEKEGLLMTHD